MSTAARPRVEPPPRRTVRPENGLLPSAAAFGEACRELLGGHAVDPEHTPHLKSAINWIVRAQDVTPGGGIARGYALRYNAYFELRGWEADYPETTGYIIPTLFMAANRLRRPELKRRAVRAARWEVAMQLPNGGVQGGVIGQETSHSVFNTGQVLFGWLSAWHETGEAMFEQAIHQAARFLVEHQDADGLWRRGNSRFADRHATLYNARTAWALAAAGTRLRQPAWLRAARLGLHAVADHQHDDGWVPNCCLVDPSRPLLHTLAYTVQGLLEGGRVLGDMRLIACARHAAHSLAEQVDDTGWMAGRFARGWRPASRWACLTGMAQMASVWLRLAALEPSVEWRAPAQRVIRFLKHTQNRRSSNDGLRGGIRGSAPIGGQYGPYEVLAWATKFFADALLRDEPAGDGPPTSDGGVHEALA